MRHRVKVQQKVSEIEEMPETEVNTMWKRQKNQMIQRR